MTEKRFEINNIASQNNFSFWDNENKLIMNASGTLDVLNEQHETIQFKRKHILCLQSVIQTIDVEIQEKGMTKERFEEIKTYWYRKFNGDIK